MSTWEELKELGNAEFKKQQYHQAISLYTDAIKINPEQEVLFANRALCYKALNNFRNAILDLDRAISINPRSVKNLKRKAEVSIIVGNYAEAVSCYQKCTAFEPRESSHKSDLILANSYQNNFNEILTQFQNENYEKSEELSAKLLLPSPFNKDLKIIYLESMISNNKLKEASEYWSSKLGESERIEDEFLYLVCKIFYYEGNYEKAKNFLKKLLNKVNDNPKYNKLYQAVNNIEREKEKANVLFKEAKYNDAITAYTTILEIDPHNKIFNSTIIANRALCKSLCIY